VVEIPRERKWSWHEKTRKGKRWFTNGSKDIMSYECPIGFFPGRTNFIYPKKINKEKIV
jgi:hypothetical protein